MTAPNVPHVPGCSGKPKYGDEAAAIAATKRGKDPKWTADGRKRQPRYPYRCPFCHCWHLSGMTPEAAALSIKRAAQKRERQRPIWDRVRDRMPGGGR